MDEKQIPYIAYEAEQARSERNIKRLIIALIISVILIFASNALWLYAWCQYDYSSEKTTSVVDVDGKQGNANYIGNNGDINNGKNSSEKDYPQKNTETQKR